MSDINEMSGTLVQKIATKTFPSQTGGDGFTVGGFILCDDHPEYPKFFKFQLSGKSLTIADNIALNSKINVKYNLGGSRQVFTDKDGQPTAYINLIAWNIMVLQQQGYAQPQGGQQQQQPFQGQGYAQPQGATGGQPVAQPNWTGGSPGQQSFGDNQPLENDIPF